MFFRERGARLERIFLLCPAREKLQRTDSPNKASDRDDRDALIPPRFDGVSI